MRWLEAQHIVAMKWGIKFHRAGWCVVTKEFVDSVDEINAVVKQLIAEEYGEGWEDRFYQEVRSEETAQYEVIELIEREPYIKQAQDSLLRLSAGLEYNLIPKDSSICYDVVAYEFQVINGVATHVPYYRMEVDRIAKEVRRIQDS
jgi:hypothetical protein